eukprot:TRINITY_DN26579_c0_g1_i1.p1 TRINITY_DN26579_c0_g1~~TRINITY_DN26579_c0_g1_i1.p1  ORF type:complete len:429 (+),score=74.54 TRINITY_DN26579_c0_g1_i1:121-1407(+)
MAASADTPMSRAACLIEASRCWPSRSVIAQESRQGDVELVATKTCGEGDILLAVPESLCLTSAALSKYSANVELDEDNSFGMLVIATLCMARGDKAEGISSDLQAYYEAAAPSSHFDVSAMVCWASESVAARRLSGSISWLRAQKLAADYEREWKAVSAGGFNVSYDQYRWAALVVRTRAFEGSEPRRCVLAPVVDLANHASGFAQVGPNARVQFEEAEVRLVATRGIAVGESVTISYGDMDYLDTFERYGFLDESNSCHTVEISLPYEDLFLECQDSWRQVEIQRLWKENDANEFDAWWLPLIRPDKCPLVAALRAIVITQEEMLSCKDAPIGNDDGTDSDRLKSPVAAERVVMDKLAELIRVHLAGYSTSLQQDEAELKETLASSERADAVNVLSLRLAVFEKSLLGRILTWAIAGGDSACSSLVA